MPQFPGGMPWPAAVPESPPPPGLLNGPSPDRSALGRHTIALGMILLSTGCGSLTVDPSDEPELSASRQPEPGSPESTVLLNLRSAEWAQAHGLPVNPHRGGGPSITFFAPGGSIRRHVALSEADLRPAPRVRTASNYIPTAARVDQVNTATASLRVRGGELTDSIVVIGSTEQLWVFEDGVLITKTILIVDADTVAGASQLAFDELGEFVAEQWVPRSNMGPINDPEDPQWEMSYPLAPAAQSVQVLLASCEFTTSFDDCASAVSYAVAMGVIAVGVGAVCARTGWLCGLARTRAAAFWAMVIVAIATCLGGGDEMSSPALHGSAMEPYPITA